MASSRIAVGAFGAGGRMGSTVCAAVAADPELELLAAVDPSAVGPSVEGVTITDNRTAMKSAAVAVDFTVASGARENVRWCAESGVHAVVGTTGLGEDDVDDFRRRFTTSNCIVAPNFAIGAVLMMRFAEI